MVVLTSSFSVISLAAGVDWLLHTASVQYPSLQERIRKDTTLESEKEEKKMQERRLRVERMKEQRRQEEEGERKRLENLEENKQQQDQSEPSTPAPQGEKQATSAVHTPGSPESLYAVDSRDNTPVACAGEVVAQEQEEVLLPGVIST